MAQPTIQTAFHAGELAPALNARVDLAKYHSAAALLRNFFVDYRGGASSRTGTKFILQGKDSTNPIRLIPFQASLSVGYVLEFGQYYIRFYNNGAPILETAKNITGASQANPCVITSVAHGFSAGDWVYILAVGGMTQLNGRYFRVLSVPTANTFTLGLMLDGSNVNSTAYTAYTAGGTVQRVYTLLSPYAAADLATLKFAQNVDKLIICHASYSPYVLTLIAATNWTLLPIVFGSTVGIPTNVSVATTLGAGAANYAFLVTAVDADGQESAASTPFALNNKQQPSVVHSNTVTWTAVTGAVSYNVYKADYSIAGVIPTGAAFGFIGNAKGTTFIDSNSLAPDFSLTPPVVKNPFQGAPVDSITVTASGTYVTYPTVTVADPPSGGVTATAIAYLGVISSTLSATGSGFTVGQILIPRDTSINFGNLQIRVDAVNGSNQITAYTVVSPGSITFTPPANPVEFIQVAGPITASFNLTWGVVSAPIVSGGAGYTSVPAVTFSAGTVTATGTAVLGAASAGNPAVPVFFQQRLVLAAQPNAVQTFYMSQPGQPYNFNISDPLQANDAITGSLVSYQLNDIRAMIPMPSGLIIVSSAGAWLVNGGSAGSPVAATGTVANAQSYAGCGDLPPIVVNFDILYVQAKNSIVRDLAYNFYTQVFTGTDISVLSSHLFYGYTLFEWAWAQEPFKVVWAVRSDGTLLSLTLLKEQELVGWSHSDTNGTFKSVATISEQTSTAGIVDAIYVVVQRTINGSTVKYIERFAERIFPNGVADAWCVDAGLQYNGAPATSFTGGEHLAGATVTGLADGLVITPFVMPTNGSFTLATAASKVTVGLAFTPELQTLQLDLGEPTVQGKRKKITAVTVRVQDTLGLTIGGDANTQVVMKDLVVGNVGSATNAVVTGLVTGDARTIIDPRWSVPGQYLIRQPNPFPVTILGVIPEVVVGDTK